MKTITSNKGFKQPTSVGTKDNPFVVTEAEPIITGSYFQPGVYVAWCGEQPPDITQAQLGSMDWDVCPCCGVIYEIEEEEEVIAAA